MANEGELYARRRCKSSKSIYFPLIKWEECLETPSCEAHPRVKVYTVYLFKKPFLRKIFKFKKFIWGTVLGKHQQGSGEAIEKGRKSTDCVLMSRFLLLANGPQSCWGPGWECAAHTSQLSHPRGQQTWVFIHQLPWGIVWALVSGCYLLVLPACPKHGMRILLQAERTCKELQILAKGSLWIRLHWMVRSKGYGWARPVSGRLNN